MWFLLLFGIMFFVWGLYCCSCFYSFMWLLRCRVNCGFVCMRLFCVYAGGLLRFNSVVVVFIFLLIGLLC